jgi:starch-binding outer membrane protein SusE/F
MKTKLFYFLMCLFAITATNAQINSVAIVGAGIEAGGWPGEANNPGPIDKKQLTQVGTTDVWQITGLVMAGGSIKFRANNSWDAAPNGGNWGKPLTGSAFPTGIGAENSGGSKDIPAVAGTYDITFNVVTGDYSFSGGPPIAVVKLFGTATNPPSGILFSTSDGIVYTAPTNSILLAGNAQFDVDGSVAGGLTFPGGTAASPTDFIPVPAGKYTSITFNKDSGDYTFVAAPIFNSLAIVGAGSPGGWPNDPQIDPNVMTTTDGIIYKIKNIALTADAIKFRQNNNWNIDTNWTGNAFPIGILQVPGGNIAVTAAGNYDCIVNVVTGVYRFNLSSQPPVAIVGAGAGGWPADPQIDTNLMATIDGENYTLNNLVLTSGDIKFRQNNNFVDQSWGGTAFPTGSPSGSNLTATAGTWDVTFTRSTGAYSFTTSLAVKNFKAASFKAYPNPTKNSWNITSGNDDITSVRVYDILGKSVYAKTASSKEVTVNAADLSKGVYFAKVSTANGTSTVKLVKE